MSLPISLVGAMQRCAPHLTSLWLEWLGVPDLHGCTFEVTRGSSHGPATTIRLPNRVADPKATWEALADVLSLSPKSISTREIQVPYSSKAHQSFWDFARKREDMVSGPLEWWWAFCILRLHSVDAASVALLTQLGLKESDFRSSLVNFVNPTLDSRGRLVDASEYRQPIAMEVVEPVDYTSRSTLRIDLTQSQARVATALIEVALSR